jgi:hypothetical protein
MIDGSNDATTWDRAQDIDPTVRASTQQRRTLQRRQLSPLSFSRDVLFASMARGRPVLFNDMPVNVRRARTLGTREAVVRALKDGFSSSERLRVRCGPSRTPKYLTLDHLLTRWADDRTIVNVTDFHIRDSGIMTRIDISVLSSFNLLARAPAPIGTEEILTMVVSSAGALSDSHTDDPDGSNHCFAGQKLWLVWDTFEGIARGLEDVERCDVYGDQAAFSISHFLAVPSARWFVVSPGQTLFLPGHLTHKVITLERYLGVGSFFVMLPSYLRTLMRWTQHTPLWALTAPPERRLDLVDLITQRVIRKIGDLSKQSRAQKEYWGLPYLQAEAKTLLRQRPRYVARLFRDNPRSLELLRAIQTL